MLDKPLLLDIPDGISFSTDDPLVFRKQAIYVGSFAKHKPDGSIEMEFDVDEACIDHWVKTHNDLLEAGIDVPMPIHHVDDPQSRAATVLSLEKDKDSKGRVSLFARLKFKDVKLANDLKDSQVSIYSPPVYHHNKKTFIRPIRHICFTDYPVVGDLDPLTIAASYDPKEKKMTLKQLAKALGVELKDDADDAAAGKAITSAFNALKKSVKASEDALEAEKNKPPVEEKPVPRDPLTVRLAKENRELKIDGLLNGKKITAAAAKGLKEKWCSETVSLSEDNVQAFDSVIASLETNQPMPVLAGEQSPAQKFDPDSNSLVANAKKRAGK